jgi:UDP-GlcNAc:undecaprenyl-phosphate GlcNAc-1-phosphate transferase
MLAVIAGGFAGFLIFNRNPAKIFMGDTGSMLAGFSLATLTIGSPLAHTKVFALELAYPVLTFVYPIFDVALVSILRSIAGRSISIGGRDHSSHRIALAGLGERRTVWILWTLTALGGFAGLLIQWEPLVLGAAAALVLLLFTVFGIFLANLPSARERAVE